MLKHFIYGNLRRIIVIDEVQFLDFYIKAWILLFDQSLN